MYFIRALKFTVVIKRCSGIMDVFGYIYVAGYRADLGFRFALPPLSDRLHLCPVLARTSK